jgi:hypothetical protein
VLPRGKPFAPGYDPRRNPGGTPKDGESLLDVLKRKIPYEEIAAGMDELVRARDPRTIHYMADRHLGRPAQSIQVSGDPERPLHALIGVVARDLQPLAAQDAPTALPTGEAHCLDDLDGA